MTPFIASRPVKVAAAAPSRSQSAPDATPSADPFAIHLDQAAAKRADKKDAASVKDATPAAAQAKPRKEVSKTKDASKVKKKQEDAPVEDAEEPQPEASIAEQEVDETADGPQSEELKAEDICHQQDSLFAQALLNPPAPRPEVKAEAASEGDGEETHEESAAKITLPNLPQEKPGPRQDAAIGAPKGKQVIPQNKQVTTPEMPAAHDDPLQPEQKKDEASAKPEPIAEETSKPAPRNLPPHWTQHTEGAKHAQTSVAASQVVKTAPLEAMAEAVKPLPEAAPEEPQAAAPMPIAASQSAPQMTIHSAETARVAQESPQPTREGTFEQIVLGLRTKMDAANQKANIELNPPNLGKLHVSVELSNGLLTAQFRASTDLVRDLLSANMDHLRSVLEGQGIAVDKLAVTATPANPDANPTASQNQNSGTQSHDGRSGGAFANDRHAPRQGPGGDFAKMWRAALDKDEPIDLLA